MLSEYQEIAILMIVCAVLGIICLIQHYRREFEAEREKERAAAKAHNDKWSQVYAARLESDNRQRKPQQPAKSTPVEAAVVSSSVITGAVLIDYACSDEASNESYTCDDSYCSEVSSSSSDY